MDDFESFKKTIGSFERLFDKKRLYGELLHLKSTCSDEDCLASFIEIQEVIKGCPNLEHELHSLFDCMNWRMHLVASLTLLLEPSLDLSEKVWWAINNGSWVSPQLTVVAYYHDPFFSRTAMKQLINRSQITTDDTDFSMHKSEDDLGKYGASCTNFASLIAVCQFIPSIQPFLTDLLRAEDVKKCWQMMLLEERR